MSTLANPDFAMRVLKGGIQQIIEAKLTECGLHHVMMGRAVTQAEVIHDPMEIGPKIRIAIRHTEGAKPFMREITLQEDIETAVIKGIIVDLAADVVDAVMPYFLMTAYQERKDGQHTGG